MYAQHNHVQIYYIISSICFLYVQCARILIHLHENETSAHSGCSCVHNNFDIIKICSWLYCDVRSLLVWQWQSSEAALYLSSICIHVFSSTSPSCIWSSLSKKCGCVSYQIFSPVIHIYVQHRLSPLQLLSSRGMTQFLFIIIMHSLPAWIDYTHATLCPQFNFVPGGM